MKKSELRAELTQLADERDWWLSEFNGADRDLIEYERELNDLRACATEAYEHGVSDGIDMGREFAHADADDEFDAGYDSATRFAVTVLDGARKRLTGEAE